MHLNAKDKNFDKFCNYDYKDSVYKAVDHFVGADKMVKIGSDTKREVPGYRLSRYACYLIVQNVEVKKFDKFHNYDYRNSGYRGMF